MSFDRLMAVSHSFGQRMPLAVADRLKRLIVPGDRETHAIYHHMLLNLQRDMLILLLVFQIPLSTIVNAYVFNPVWRGLAPLNTAFVLQNTHLVLLVGCVVWWIRKQRIGWAWLCAVVINLGTILVHVAVLHEPNALFLGIFTLAGAAIVWPARITLPLVALLAGCYTLIIGQTQPANLDLAIAILLGFLSLMLGFECIGWVIRRFVRRSAQLSLEMQQTTNQQVRLEQQMADLHQHVKHITSLEHDLRQPLRSIQGNLAVLAVEAPDASDLLLPTIAATQRVDRLINNLLDLTRAEARQADTVRRPLDLQLFLRQLATTTSGLSRYYTAPPIPIVMECAEPITVLVDREQFERAILNVLDNALAYSPPDGSIGLRAVRDHNRCVITICDQGPGIPDQIVAALTAGAEVFSRRASRPCLGLRQVWAMAQSHHGTVECIVQNGTQIRLCLPDVQG